MSDLYCLVGQVLKDQAALDFKRENDKLKKENDKLKEDNDKLKKEVAELKRLSEQLERMDEVLLERLQAVSRIRRRPR